MTKIPVLMMIRWNLVIDGRRGEKFFAPTDNARSD